MGIELVAKNHLQPPKTIFLSHFSRMYLYVIRMSLVCSRMSSVCHLYVLVCHPYVTRMHPYVIRMYLYVIRMSLVCTRISPVCRSYVLVRHPYVTRMWFCHKLNDAVVYSVNGNYLFSRGKQEKMCWNNSLIKSTVYLLIFRQNSMIFKKVLIYWKSLISSEN